VPQRGDKKTLAETVARNAEQALQQHKLRRAGDLSTRSKALEEIAEALAMQSAPLRIECYDVSQIQGTDVVASMVVFEDGLSRKSEYRRFAINGATDDVSAISEVLRRRFARYLDAKVEIDEAAEADPSRPGIDPTTGRPRKFAYPPQLVVVDGGQPQVQAAAQVLLDLGIDDIAICGLAKRLEEVWLPDDEFPVILPRASEGLYLLQRVRDEAHRFAITYHRQKRSKRMTASTLDDVPGLGEIRRKALLRHFGSLKRLKAASLEEIAEVPGIGRRTAEAILAALNGEAPPPRDRPAPDAGRPASPTASAASSANGASAVVSASSADGVLAVESASSADGAPNLDGEPDAGDASAADGASAVDSAPNAGGALDVGGASDAGGVLDADRSSPPGGSTPDGPGADRSEVLGEPPAERDAGPPDVPAGSSDGLDGGPSGVGARHDQGEGTEATEATHTAN
jgi:excinuclease ABC subunit C